MAPYFVGLTSLAAFLGRSCTSKGNTLTNRSSRLIEDVGSIVVHVCKALASKKNGECSNKSKFGFWPFVESMSMINYTFVPGLLWPGASKKE